MRKFIAALCVMLSGVACAEDWASGIKPGYKVVTIPAGNTLADFLQGIAGAPVNAVTNGGATVNGNAISNGAVITLTGSGGPSYPETTNIANAAVAGYSNCVSNAVVLAKSAWQNPASATNWTWTKTSSNVTLTSYNFSSLDVVIPDMLDGLPVTGFGTIFGSSSITSISGGKNIVSISSSAFAFCSSLASVALPSVTNIGNYAFRECSALSNVYLPSIYTVGQSAFSSCTALQGISLPGAVSIGSSAFGACTELKYISLPSVTNIGVGGIYDCPALTNLSLPSVRSLGDGALALCPTLTSVFFEQNAPTEGYEIYSDSLAVTNYVTNPTATGWGATFGGRPVVRIPLYGSGASLTGITAEQVGAVPTNRTITINGGVGTLDSNLSFTVSASVTPATIANAEGLTNRSFKINGDPVYAGVDLTVTGSGISASTATNIYTTANASRTNPVVVTFSQLCTNGPTLLTIPMPYAAVRITKLRVYTLGTNVSVRGRADITEKSTGRCTDLIYFTTNMLFHSMTTTVAGVAGEWTNVVTDASGILTGRDNLYAKPLLNPITWQRATNTTATTIAWACTNMVPDSVGGLLTHASALPEMTYINRQGETNLYYWHTWNSPRTNGVGIWMELEAL